ncbi:MAG: zinc-binding dehydrogenase [Candidatus Bathyarchaeia archaeon]
MPEKGKAAVMVGFNKPFEVREYPLPKVEPGAILVRMLSAGVCGTDVHTWLGHTGGKVLSFPVILGHENVGEIAALGEGVERDWAGEPISVGDRITWPTTIGRYCYRCYNCVVAGYPNKCLNRRTYGAALSCDKPPHFTGGWAQYCYLFPETAVFKLPKDLPADALVATGCAAPTMIHAAERAGIREGDTVAVQGSGAVGLFGTIIAKESGADKVIVIGGPKERLELAKRWGADHTIDISEVRDPGERIRLVKEYSIGGQGADVVFECSGVPNAFAEGVRMARDGGTYVVVGQFMDAGPVEGFHPFWVTFKHITIKGSYSWEPRHTWRAVRFMSRTNSKYKFADLVSHRFPLEETTKAVEMVRDWKVVKAVLDPWM